MSKPNLLKQIEHALRTIRRIQEAKEEIKTLKNGDTIPTNIQPKRNK